MMCYQDMTFCTGGNPLCAKFKKCPRALTETVREGAKNAGVPIAYFAKPEEETCYVKPENSK